MRARGVWPRCDPSMLTSAHGFTRTSRPPGRGRVVVGATGEGGGVAATTAAGVGEGTGEGAVTGGAAARLTGGRATGEARGVGVAAGDGIVIVVDVVGVAVVTTATSIGAAGVSIARHATQAAIATSARMPMAAMTPRGVAADDVLPRGIVRRPRSASAMACAVG